MSKSSIIVIDSDDDDDFIEILEENRTAKPNIPVKKVHTKQLNKITIQQNNTKCGSENNPPILNKKPSPKPKSTSSAPQPKPVTSPNPSFSKNPTTLPKPKTVHTKLVETRPVQAKPMQTKLVPTKPAQRKPISLPKPPTPPSSTVKPPQEPPQRPKPTSRIFSSPNPIPAPVVIYSTGGTSENLLPLDSINKLFQRDTRSITMERATRRASGLTRSPSSVNNKAKKIGIDSELAAIFAHVPEPYFSIDKNSSQTSNSSTLRADDEPVISSLPTRPSTLNSSSEGLRSGNNLFSPNSLNSPPAPTRKRPINSPQDSSPFRKPTFDKKKVIYDIYDEDGEEEGLELYINHLSSRRRLFNDEFQKAEKCKTGNKQCPLCYMMFPKQEIDNHAFDCDGKPSEKGLKKKTIGAAVAQNAAERKRKNAGIKDTGPTNYYADSEGALALDGTGFGSEATGLSWESAGQTRFA
ncbi:hypothetical protein [Parasitella parasitica]|uniref:Uncharacterized protein n=1 Tax=Parasitella parasitica TaxID=35722 RepID=A0A0B7MS69_9FUNG|nr:hypothetical protein [Parasitella parasitica]